MPAQGWAGAQGQSAALRCAICLKQHKLIYAETTISGTAVCGFHVDWIPLPVTPPGE